MKKIIPLTLISCVLFASYCFASFISLNTNLTVKTENNRLMAALTVVNKGDESAFNVQAEMRVGGKVSLAQKMNELPVNSTYQAQKSFDLSLGKPGLYPFILIMHYTDANQYPFSALTAHTFAYKQESLSPVFGQLKSATFVKEGSVVLTLRNGDTREVRTVTSLVIPKELTCNQEKIETVLPPRSEKSVEIALQNFSALAGSNYQIFAVTELDDAANHYTAVSPGMVHIVANQGIMGISYRWLYFILAVLVLIFVGSQFMRK